MSGPTPVDTTRDVTDTHVAVTAHVEAEPQTVFEFLANPANHHVFDGSEHVGQALGTEPITGVGDRFGMEMTWIVDYKTANTVVEYEQGRLIAWRHGYGKHRWRWHVVPVDGGGSAVTATFDLAHVPRLLRPVYGLVFKFPAAYVNNLRASVTKVARHFAEAS